MAGASIKNVFLLLFVPLSWAVHNLHYSDLEAINADCSPRDTCTEGSNTFATSNCECDEQCHSYDDCCINAKQTAKPAQPLSNMKCISNGTSPYFGAYVVQRCREGWVGSTEIRRQCEITNNISDPLMAAPTTDIKSKISYKNRFCAECNDVNPTNLKTWVVSVTCDSLKPVNTTGDIKNDFIRNRLIYRNAYPHRNKWGVYYKSRRDRREVFYPCELSFFIPEYLSSSARFCRPNVISTCPSNWRLRTVRENCKAFMATVYIDSITYRNVHCARCNNASITEIACTSGLLTRKRTPMSFTLLLDVNLSDGNRVGEIQQCRNGQIYDSFFKRCRSLVCALPGYKIVGDKCVRQ